MTIGQKKTIWPSRPEDGRILTGVCAGLSRVYVVDVTLLRLAMLLLAFAWGLGLVIYLVLWFVMPDSNLSGGERVSYRRSSGLRGRTIQLDISSSISRFGESWQRIGSDPWPRPLGRKWLAIILFFCGLSVFLISVGAFRWITSSRAIGLGIMVLSVAIFATLKGR